MGSGAALVAALIATAIVSGTTSLRPIERPSEDAAPAHPSSRGEFVTLRDEARGLLHKHCGSCHDPASSTAKPAALKVFNLSEEAWQIRMSKDQLDKAIGRVEGTSASKAERERFRAFVAAELDRRTSTAKGR